MPEVGQALSHFRIAEKIGKEGVIHRDLLCYGTVPRGGGGPGSERVLKFITGMIDIEARVSVTLFRGMQHSVKGLPH